MPKHPRRPLYHTLAWFCLLAFGSLMLLAARVGSSNITNAGTARAIPAAPALPQVVSIITDKKCTTPKFVFSPATLTITLGTQVKWVNKKAHGSLCKGVPHTATSNSGAWNTGNIAYGSSVTLTFNTAGTYPYHCLYHYRYMTGTIIVTGVLQQGTSKRDPNNASVALEALSPYTIMLVPLGITVAAIAVNFMLRKKRQNAFILSSE